MNQRVQQQPTKPNQQTPSLKTAVKRHGVRESTGRGVSCQFEQVLLRASASQPGQLFALDFEHELDGFTEALQAFRLGAALAVGAGHLRAEGGEPFTVPLNNRGKALSHGHTLNAGSRVDKLKEFLPKPPAQRRL